METNFRMYSSSRLTAVKGPHSLGTLIEWKRIEPSYINMEIGSPHSLGTLIEWKLKKRKVCYFLLIKSPLAGDIN